MGARGPLRESGRAVETTMPSCPAGLGAIARREWNRLAKLLHQKKLLSQLDRGVMELYCQTYESWQEATRVIRRDGLWIKTANGMIPHPLIRAVDKYAQQLRLTAQQLGLSPAARMRMVLPEEEKPDGFDAFELETGGGADAKTERGQAVVGRTNGARKVGKKVSRKAAKPQRKTK